MYLTETYAENEFNCICLKETLDKDILRQIFNLSASEFEIIFIRESTSHQFSNFSLVGTIFEIPGMALNPFFSRDIVFVMP